MNTIQLWAIIRNMGITMQQRARSEEDKIEKKYKIHAAAKQLFFEKGYHGTRIEMIARQAGISTGTFYLYYKNKIEVYKALQAEGIEILTEMILYAISRPGMGALEKLSEVVGTYFQFYHEYRKYFDILAMLSASPEGLKEDETEISKVLDSNALRLLKVIETVLVEGVETREIISIDTWKAANVLWGMMDGLVLLGERRNIENVINIPLTELVQQALDISFYGIAGKPRPEREGT